MELLLTLLTLLPNTRARTIERTLLPMMCIAGRGGSASNDESRVVIRPDSRFSSFVNLRSPYNCGAYRSRVRAHDASEMLKV